MKSGHGKWSSSLALIAILCKTRFGFIYELTTLIKVKKTFLVHISYTLAHMVGITLSPPPLSFMNANVRAILMKKKKIGEVFLFFFDEC